MRGVCLQFLAGTAGTRTNKKAAHLKRCFFIWDFKAAGKS
jgi:hypothetical protein